MLRAPRFLVVLALAALLPLTACGGKTPESATPTPVSSVSGSAKAVEATPPPPPSALPAMQPMPPPGVRGSDVAKVEEVDALYTCQAAAPVTGKEAKGDAAKLAAACAKVPGSWTKVLAQAVTQGDGDPAAKIPFRAEAGRCYRVYTAHDAAVTAMNVTVRDAAGKDAADDGGSALPRAGRLCFTASGDASLLVAVGAGRGVVAVELWSTAK
jgi:hypothetical protein